MGFRSKNYDFTCNLLCKRVKGHFNTQKRRAKFRRTIACHWGSTLIGTFVPYLSIKSTYYYLRVLICTLKVVMCNM